MLWTEPDFPDVATDLWMNNHYPAMSCISFLCTFLLVLLSPRLCFSTGFMCYLFVARNDLWMNKKTSTRTKQMYVFTTMETASEDWNSVKLA